MPWPNATTSILTLSAPRSSCALQVLLRVRFRFKRLASRPWKTTRHAVAVPAAAAPERIPSAPGAARASDWVTTAPRDGALLSILSRNSYRRRATRRTRYLNILKPAAGPQSGAHYFCQPHLAKIVLPCGRLQECDELLRLRVGSAMLSQRHAGIAVNRIISFDCTTSARRGFDTCQIFQISYASMSVRAVQVTRALALLGA